MTPLPSSDRSNFLKMSNVDIESIALDMDDTPEVSEADKKKLAETKKELGNQQFKLKNYSKAIPFYTEAIELCPDNASYYGNRSACYMMQGYYSQALDDARKSVKADPKFIKGWIRVAKCMMAIGDISAAENALSRVAELDPKNAAYIQEMKNFEVIERFNKEAIKSYEKEDFRKVVFCLDRALEVGGSCTRFKVLKAECLARLGRYQEAQELANEVLTTDKKNTDAIFVRGLCLYYQDNVDQAFSHFQHVLKLAPDHSKASAIYKKAKSLKQKKEEGNEAFKAGNLNDAHKLYTEALAIDSCNGITNAKLHFNRATVSFKLGKLDDSVDDCTAALGLDTNYLKALLRRAKCYMDLSKFEEAVRDYEEAFKKDKSPEIRKQLHNAKLELKKSLRKDYYKILGIDKTASSDEIKRAYRKRALVHHPDRHANAPESEKKEQEKMFKEVGEAYTVLSDPNKRRRYDNGQDLDEFGDASDIDANAMFQQFFSATTGAQFFTQGFSGGPSFSFSFG